MAYRRIVVPLTADERGALLQIAELECRDPREQMRFLLRQEAQLRGLIGYADAIGCAISEHGGNGNPNLTAGVSSSTQHTEHSGSST